MSLPIPSSFEKLIEGLRCDALIAATGRKKGRGSASA